MNARSIQILTNAKAIRLAVSTFACGISLAFAMNGVFDAYVHSTTTARADTRAVELRVLKPLRELEKFHFRQAASMPPANVESLAAVVANPDPAEKLASPKAAAPVRVIHGAPSVAKKIIRAAKARPSFTKAKEVAQLPLRKIAAAPMRKISATQQPERKSFAIASSAKKAMRPFSWIEFLKVAEYIAGENLGLPAGKPLEMQGALIADGMAKAMPVIDGGLTERDAAWMALVDDAKRVDAQDALPVKKTDSMALRGLRKMTREKVLAAPLVAISEPAVREESFSPTYIKEAAVNVTPVVAKVSATPEKVRDQVNSLVGAVSRDGAVTERMGIQEDEEAKTDNAAFDFVGFAKKIIQAELPPAAPASPSAKIASNPNPAAPEKALPIEVVARKSASEGEIAASDSKYIRIVGKLANEARGYPGHFEVGFYRAVNPLGVPVGAPFVQSILKNGQLNFSFRVPRAADGFLFARFVTADRDFKAAEWHGYPHELELKDVRGDQVALTIPMNKTAHGASLASAREKTELVLRGSVGAMFAPKGKFQAIEGVKVRLRGTSFETHSEKDGSYILKTPAVQGRVLVEFLKGGYLPRVLEVDLSARAGNEISVAAAEIASREVIRHMAQSLGLHHSSTSSVVVVEARGKLSESGLPGISAQLTLKAEGPFYFSDKGFPKLAQKATSGDGRMIFFNVEPGVGFLETFVLGDAVTPVVVAPLGEGEVVQVVTEFFEGETKVTGKVLDPIRTRAGTPIPVVGAKVRVAGGTDWTETDSFGNFELPNLKFVRGKEILLEVTKAGYYDHRFTYRLPAEKSGLRAISLYMFPQEYINRLATSAEIELNPNYGLLMGKVGGGEKVRVDALLDHSGDNVAKDFYFDEKNVIQGSHAWTDPRFGTYMIFDVAPGRALLQGHNQAGEMRYSELSYFSPSTINVLVAE